MPKANNKQLPGTIIALLVASLMLGLELSGALVRLENISYDWRVKQMRSDLRATDEVAVILIDDASLNTMNPLVGRWPWPRSVHADMIDFLALANPRAIVFDILFTENEANGGGGGVVSASDQRLVDATADAGNVVHAMQIHLDVEDEINTTLLNRPMSEIARAHAVHQQGINAQEKNNNFYLPMPALLQTSHGLGVVTADPDDDGIYRRARLFRNYQGDLFPSLAIASLLQGRENEEVTALENDYLVNFYGQINTYSAGGVLASAQQLMNGEMDNLLVDPYEFENRIVFIGASAVGLEDLKATPLSSTMPGVMIHASVAANIISGDVLHVVPKSISMIIGLIAGLGVLLVVLYQRHLHIKVVTPLVVGVAYVAFCFYAFAHNYVFEMATPLAAIALSSVLGSVYLLFTEGRDKRRVRNMLSQYVSPAVLNTVVDQYEDYIKAEVGSEECLSILFSDIRGFTSLSEAASADKVVEMLNHYFSAMTETIFNQRGTVDKFIGDAIMAFWGAPIKEEHHADLAVRAAIEMHYRLKEVNQWLEEKAYPTVQIGVGINSGKVILGNIGSIQKLDYTVIGDNVNLASRLEGLTKQYGSTVVISEYTYELLNEPMPCYVLDLVRVKGKQVPIRIYGPILDMSDEASEREAAISQEAFAAYLNQEWSKAIELYSSLSSEILKQAFVERCRSYQKIPPPSDWDGVFTMTTK